MRNKTKLSCLSAALLSSCLIFNSFAQQSGMKPITNGAPISKIKVNTKSSGSNQSTVQNNSNSTHCASDDLMKKYIAENHLEAIYAQEKLNKQNTSSATDNDRTIKTVPVVFHIVYNPNISASAQMNTKLTTTVINSIIARLNVDYSKTTTTGVRPDFHNLIANTNIQFCLANKDATGAVTTGIVRTTTSQTFFDESSASMINGANAMKTTGSGSAGWDHLKYLNIWLCDITDNMNLCSSGCTAGYAYLGTTSQSTLPNTLNGVMVDGIVLDYNIGLFDNPGTSDLTISKSITHEVGHYLGLEHTFSDNTNACINDDGFSDTPPVEGPFQNSYYCSQATTVQSCTPGILWQYENLMDYSDCFVMFTPMQANYMNDVLTNGRYGLINWQATACSSGTLIPVASFSGCNSNVSQNATITLTNTSANFPTSWLWSITPSTGVTYVNSTSATSQNPQVNFANSGTYSVALTATNSAGSNTSTGSTCITVVTVNPGGACDSLLNITSDDTLAVYSSSNGGYITGMNGYYDQAKAEKFLSASYTAGNALLGAYVYFYKYVYASAASSIKVNLWNATGTGGSPGATPLATKNVLLNTIPNTGQSPGFVYIPFSSSVFVSGDFFVGVDFTDPYVAGDSVAIISNRNGNTPSPGTAWEKYNNTWGTISAGWGSNLSLYIVPVLCPVTTAIEELKDIDDISIYPNPSNGTISIMIGLNKDSDVKINVYNTLGQIVKSADMKSGTGGKVDFDLSGSRSGIYFVEIKTKSSIVTRRLILNK